MVSTLSNATLHARVGLCTVRVHIDDAVHPEADDDGIGLPRQCSEGRGGRSMAMMGNFTVT